MGNIAVRVSTKLALHVDEQFKGTVVRDVYLNPPGGHVVFGANARADVGTIESSSIGTGLGDSCVSFSEQ